MVTLCITWRSTFIHSNIHSWSLNGTRCVWNVKPQSSRGRSNIAVRCSMCWWRQPPFHPRACTSRASRPQPPHMDPPKVESACGVLDCFAIDVGWGRPHSGASCIRACRGSVRASTGTLLSWGGPCLELPRVGRPRYLESPCLSAHCMLWVEVTHTRGLLEARPQSHRPWRMGCISWLCSASFLSSTGPRSVPRPISCRTSSTGCRF